MGRDLGQTGVTAAYAKPFDDRVDDCSESRRGTKTASASGKKQRRNPRRYPGGAASLCCLLWSAGGKLGVSCREGSSEGRERFGVKRRWRGLRHRSELWALGQL